MKTSLRLAGLGCALALLTTGLSAQVPTLVNYQGRVAVNGVNFDGSGTFKFALVDGGVNQNVTATATAVIGGLGDGMGPRVLAIDVVNGGSGYTAAPAVTISHPVGTGAAATATVVGGVVTEITVTDNGLNYGNGPTTVTIDPPSPNIVPSVSYWSNDGSSVAASEPTLAVTLTVTKGLYSVLLGDATLSNMAAIPAAAFANPDVRLRVWFDDGATGSQLLTPDQRLAPTAYLADGSVTSAALTDGSVVAAKIAPATITGSLIAPGSLDSSHLAVPAAPGAGQVLGFDGVNLTWTAPGGGDGIWALAGTNAFYNAGHVGIGTNAPGLPLSILTPTSTYGLEQTDGTIRIATFVGGSTGGGWLGTISNHKLSFFTNNGSARMTVDTGGNVGVGTITPASKFTVQTSSAGLGAFRAGLEHTDGTVRLGTYAEPSFGGWFGTISNHPLNFFTNDGLPSLTIDTGGATTMTGGSPGTFTVGTPSAETGATLKRGANRADIRFDGSTFKFVAGPGVGPPPSTSGIAVNTAGNVGIGTTSPAAKLDVIGTTRTSALTITGGADIAEPFQMKEQALEKGSVVVIDEEHPGHLKCSRSAYDTRVAGIVSGANGINAGISLRQEGVMDGGENVALSGRVYVRADASGGPIHPGDMLTTSDSPGQAMKVGDHARAQGAVIGKAMSTLDEGTGMVLVLVSLQ